MQNRSATGKDRAVKFGTFTGVFTPSILTIFGVIMFMRSNYVVGQAGIINAVLILLLAKVITCTTTLSIGAISSNLQVRGGGVYYLVSRVLGAEFGGAIGLSLFLAQAVSIVFYTLGFVEAVTLTFPHLQQYFMQIGMISVTGLFFIAVVGVNIALTAQFIIMAVLFSSILVYLSGAFSHFSVARFFENLGPSVSSGGFPGFWVLFAIYFPGVTGFIGGVDMSGNLKNPSESLTKGTLYAIALAFTVYFLQIIAYGGAFSREQLINFPFQTMVDNAYGGASFMVLAGVAAATLSSALGRFMGTPRVIQAIARDEILPVLKPFGKGYGTSDEPRIATTLCLMIALTLFWIGGDGSGGRFLNSVASIMSMFFLYAFGLLNLAAFMESYSQNPSFRPRFRFFHWSVALTGVISSFGSAILVDFRSALIAGAVLWLLVWYLRRREMVVCFGDARRGYFYRRIQQNLFALKSLPEDSRNWRPSILALQADPDLQESIISFSVWLNAGRGLVVIAGIICGKLLERSSDRSARERQIDSFLKEKRIRAIPQVVVADGFAEGMRIILRGSAYGPLRPNILVSGWRAFLLDGDNCIDSLREATCLAVSQIVVCDRGKPDPVRRKRVDIWWRGQKNGPLMILMAHLLVHNREWSDSRIVLKRVVFANAMVPEAKAELAGLLRDSRVCLLYTSPSPRD